jgi:hypothetical protein
MAGAARFPVRPAGQQGALPGAAPGGAWSPGNTAAVINAASQATRIVDQQIGADRQRGQQSSLFDLEAGAAQRSLAEQRSAVEAVTLMGTLQRRIGEARTLAEAQRLQEQVTQLQAAIEEQEQARQAAATQAVIAAQVVDTSRRELYRKIAIVAGIAVVVGGGVLFLARPKPGGRSR